MMTTHVCNDDISNEQLDPIDGMAESFDFHKSKQRRRKLRLCDDILLELVWFLDVQNLFALNATSSLLHRACARVLKSVGTQLDFCIIQIDHNGFQVSKKQSPNEVACFQTISVPNIRPPLARDGTPFCFERIEVRLRRLFMRRPFMEDSSRFFRFIADRLEGHDLVLDRFTCHTKFADLLADLLSNFVKFRSIEFDFCFAEHSKIIFCPSILATNRLRLNNYFAEGRRLSSVEVQNFVDWLHSPVSDEDLLPKTLILFCYSPIQGIEEHLIPAIVKRFNSPGGSKFDSRNHFSLVVLYADGHAPGSPLLSEFCLENAEAGEALRLLPIVQCDNRPLTSISDVFDLGELFMEGKDNENRNDEASTKQALFLDDGDVSPVVSGFVLHREVLVGPRLRPTLFECRRKPVIQLSWW